MKKYEKHLYTEEELKELFQWFDNQDFPADMRLDKSTYIPDLRTTLTYLKWQAENYREELRLQGCITLLERIKAKLEGNEKNEE